MRVILDFPGGRKVFERPHSLIAADSSSEVPMAFAAIEHELRQGRYVCGWLGYELGYALEPKLSGLLFGRMPLIRLGAFDTPETAAAVDLERAYCGPLHHNWTEEDYLSRFAAVKEQISAGDIYQANLSYRALFKFVGDPFGLYETLKKRSQIRWGGFVDDGERQIVSLSPEQFFEISANNLISVRPMKGTVPRTESDAADREKLVSSEKNRAENLMIVDLVRNDLGRISETGSVKVEKLFDVETYPTLHAMVSMVTAELRDNTNASSILKSLFPCGSITGAPKIRAMEILRELEGAPRGPYCGAIGFFAPDFSAQFNVAIRTAVIKGSVGLLGLGSGVVHDSLGHEEYAECLLKAQFFDVGRLPLHLIETLRWDGEFVRLESHLARMKRSAGIFALAFNSDKAVVALASAVEGLSGPQRVRLTLGEDGCHQAVASPLDPNPVHWTYEISKACIKSSDLFQQHKTSWRGIYEQHHNADELLFCNERGELAEGSRSNIFLKRNDMLLTPPLNAGALDGRLRAELISAGKARESVLTPADLESAEVFCGNSLRGLIPMTPLVSYPGRPAI